MQGFAGEIRMFAGNYAPQNWAFCEGQTLAIANYQTLFSVIVNQFGGDGRETFKLPDFRGRMPIGPGIGPNLPYEYQQGMQGGEPSIVIHEENLPSDLTATVMATTEMGDTSSPDGAYLAESTADTSGPGGTKLQSYSSNPTSTVPMAPGSMKITEGVATPMSIVPPVTACYYIICINGEYPPRS